METGGTAGFQWSCQNSSLDTLALSIIVISSVVYCLYRYQRYRWSSFNNVPGLPDGHWLWGVLPTMLKSEAEVPYSTTFSYQFVLGVPRLVTIDPSTVAMFSPIPRYFPSPTMSRATSYPLRAVAYWRARLTIDRGGCSRAV
ncbi:hypothetical protein I350_03610 [Cryptococcus amylolentus CBS 6273]|uniref:Cytochrome P450 n=1 Tax=Cryptococcus amylolentus CBS 6273 TaxID=1296118 RepID=A0A1E3K669_9TREE|nr:hypothetical protein I350_03610 [Cryptococcus amylolentus CBS 6273]